MLFVISVTAQNGESRENESLNEDLLIVKAVYVDSNGIKWFGTSQGLLRYDNLEWKFYTTEDYLAGNQVNALTFEKTDSSTVLWVATTKGVSALAIDMEGVTGSESYTTKDGLLDDDVSDIAIDSYHGKFFSSESGLTWLHEGDVDSIIYSKYPMSMVDAPIRQLAVYKDTLYLAADGGIGRFVSGVDGISGASRWTSGYGITPFSENIFSIVVDSNAIQWFGTDVGVEEHVGYEAKDNWFLHSSSDGLVNDHVISIAQSPEGGMWFGTLGGVSSLSMGFGLPIPQLMDLSAIRSMTLISNLRE